MLMDRCLWYPHPHHVSTLIPYNMKSATKKRERKLLKMSGKKRNGYIDMIKFLLSCIIVLFHLNNAKAFVKLDSPVP